MVARSLLSSGHERSDGSSPPIPWSLQSRKNTLCSLFFLSIAFSFTTGPTVAWQLLQPIMLKEGVFICGAANTTSPTTIYSAGQKLNE